MDNGKVFERLIHLARKNNVQVKFASLYDYGRIKGDRIGIANDVSIEQMNNILAYGLAHYYLHYDKGNILHIDDEKYEEQAERAAKMLIDMAVTA